MPANNLYVAASGTVAQADKAFKVRLNVYSVRGAALRAPASAPTIPASLAHVVTGVVGLSQSVTHPLSSRIIAPPPAGYRNGQPWSLFWDQKLATEPPTAYGAVQPYAVRGYTPRPSSAAPTAWHGPSPRATTAAA